MRATSLARLLALASAVYAEGINCNGPGACSSGNFPSNTAQVLLSYISGVDPSRWYNNGEYIACYNGICAFLQDTGGAPGSNIPGLAKFLVQHGCKICGTVPYFYPSDNNVADGSLTFTWVSNGCGNGLC